MKTTHTFGGLGMLGRLFEFETPEGGGDGGVATIGSEVGDADLEGLDPAVFGDEPVVPAAVEPPVAPVDPPPLSRDDILSLTREGSSDAFRTLLAEAEAQQEARAAAAAAQQRPELPPWDPFDPAVVQAHTLASLAPAFQRIEALLAPALQATQQMQNREGETAANTFLDGLKTGDQGIGDFDNSRAIERGAILAHRDGLEPTEALARAAREERAYVEGIEKSYLARLKTRVEARDGLTREPAGGSGAAGEVVETLRGPGAYEAQLRTSLANRGQGRGVGTPTG